MSFSFLMPVGFADILRHLLIFSLQAFLEFRKFGLPLFNFLSLRWRKSIKVQYNKLTTSCEYLLSPSAKTTTSVWPWLLLLTLLIVSLEMGIVIFLISKFCSYFCLKYFCGQIKQGKLRNVFMQLMLEQVIVCREITDANQKYFAFSALD